MFWNTERCSPVTPPKYGTSSTTSSDIDILVQYQCNEGYQFSSGANSHLVKCLTNGIWNDTITDCKGVNQLRTWSYNL